MNGRVAVAIVVAALLGAFAFVFGEFDEGVAAQFRAVASTNVAVIQPLASLAGYLAIVSLLLLGLLPVFRKVVGSTNLDRTVRAELFGDGATVGEEAIRDMVGITSDELTRIFGRGKEQYTCAEYLHVRKYVRRNASIRDLRKIGVQKHLARRQQEAD